MDRDMDNEELAPELAAGGRRSTVVGAALAGKNILITGSTGFVGKVLVERILRKVPSVARLYLLVRPGNGKEGESADKRVQNLLKGSCFDRLRSEKGVEGVEALFKEKVRAVRGNLTEENLGLSPEDAKELAEKVEVVFHLAATINFDERLDEAIRLNVLGSLRVLALARRCHQRGGFAGLVHVSTAYANYPLHGKGRAIAERIQPLAIDPDLLTRQILNWPPDEVEARAGELLRRHGFANTYTLSKNITERLLIAHANRVPFNIVRPAIVGAALREPSPGWVDTLSASGALFLTSGLGVVREVHVGQQNVADIVPVDFVVSGLVLAACRLARKGGGTVSGPTETVAAEEAGAAPAGEDEEGAEPSDATVKPPAEEDKKVAPGSPVEIFHIGTSGSTNPVTWGTVCNSVIKYYVAYPPPKALRPIQGVLVTSNRLRYETRFHIRRSIPAAALWGYSRTLGRLQPPEKQEEVRKQADRFRQVCEKAYSLVSQFRAFTMKEWTFLMDSTPLLYEGLDDAEKQEWGMDAQDITWHVYIARYCYGIHRYFLKQKQAVLPHPRHTSGSQALLRASL
eukprot:Hpha_TRINITY_DN15844_c1_g4::TRINITY_DN15844_c1_g4_i1::g.187196::m.187196/K13356/FAR; alcohol-forming fatty acyl-CoA reductase